MGEFSIADAAALAILAHMQLLLDSGKGFWNPQERTKVLDALSAAKFARLRRYISDENQRESMRATWDKVMGSTYACTTPYSLSSLRQERKAEVWNARYEFFVAARNARSS